MSSGSAANTLYYGDNLEILQRYFSGGVLFAEFQGPRYPEAELAHHPDFKKAPKAKRGKQKDAELFE